jgi:hypothetical protein
MAWELNMDTIRHMNKNLLSHKRIFRLDVDDIFRRLWTGSEYNMILYFISPVVVMVTFMIKSALRSGGVECRPKYER